MTDISLKENKSIETQLAMKNIPLNSDVLSIIKSFLFYDKIVYIKHMEQKYKQKQRKDSIIRIINSPKNSQCRYYVGGYYSSEFHEKGFGNWSIWLPIPAAGWNDCQIQGTNCLKCGKYIYVLVSTLETERAIMNNKYLICVNGQH